jgi:hypothetical protein
MDATLKAVEGINFASGAILNAVMNAVNTNWFKAANAGSGGALPSTLGALTAQNTNPFASSGVPLVLWE